jgi:hypothetical protein
VNCKTTKLRNINHGQFDEHVKNKHEVLNCDECTYKTDKEEELINHVEYVHERYEITELFCVDYCNGGMGMHICWSSEDLEKWLGFDMWDVKENFTANETLYTYCSCNFKVLRSYLMKEHI